MSNRRGPLAIEQRIVRYEERIRDITVDLTETIKADGEHAPQSCRPNLCVSLFDRVSSRQSRISRTREQTDHCQVASIQCTQLNRH